MALFESYTRILLLLSLSVTFGCATTNTSVTVDQQADNEGSINNLLVLALTPIDENKDKSHGKEPEEK